jgi:hypothetical protein
MNELYHFLVERVYICPAEDVAEDVAEDDEEDVAEDVNLMLQWSANWLPVSCSNDVIP